MTDPLFFLHVMKTGGTTFVRRIEQLLPSEAIYPDLPPGAERRAAYRSIDDLVALPPERRAMFRAYTGHFPYVAVELLGEPVITASILRDPVERTISYLKHCQVHEPTLRDASLEAIYDDPWQYPMLIRNYQVKLFALEASDAPETDMDVVEIDDRRLAVACRNVEALDLLGIHSHYDDFVTAANHRFGWPDLHVKRWLQSDPQAVSLALRRRISEDNEYDMRFFDHARKVHDERSRTSPS